MPLRENWEDQVADSCLDVLITFLLAETKYLTKPT